MAQEILRQFRRAAIVHGRAVQEAGRVENRQYLHADQTLLMGHDRAGPTQGKASMDGVQEACMSTLISFGAVSAAWRPDTPRRVEHFLLHLFPSQL